MIATATLAAAADRSRRIARAWHDGDAHRAGVAAFAGIDKGDVDATCTAAAMLLADAGWIAALLAPLEQALAGDPWFEPPFRVHRDGLKLGAVLIETPRVAITASVLSADAVRAAAPPRTVVVSGRVSVVRYHRAGGATLKRWRTDPVGRHFTAADAAPVRAGPEARLEDGEVIRHDGRVEGHLLAGPDRDIATITATLRTGAAPLVREYRVADGALVRAAAVDDTSSRTAMLLTLLRVMGRRDAAPCFDAASRTADFAGRWGAMREWLALDLAAARPRLRAMTDDPHPEVRAAARATLPMAEAASCPA